MANDVVQLFMELVQINSPSKEEQNFREIIKQKLIDLDFEVTIDNKGNLLASLAASESCVDEKPIVLCAHLDTVTTAVNVNPILEDGVIKTDLTSALAADDKAAIAAILTALENIKKNKTPHKKIIVLFTVEEEIGLEGIKNFDYTELEEASGVLVFDSSGKVGSVVTSSPCKIDATITFHGKAAHAGFAPEEGISAIMMAASAIDKMKLLRIDENTTANIGTICGGEATNIVSEKCVVVLEVRSTTSQAAKMHLNHLEICCIKAIGAFGGSYDFEINEAYPSYKVEDDDKFLLMVKETIEKTSLPFKTFATGGGSDTNILRNKNIDALTLSIGYKDAHSVNESIETYELHKLTSLILEFVKGV